MKHLVGLVTVKASDLVKMLEVARRNWVKNHEADLAAAILDLVDRECDTFWRRWFNHPVSEETKGKLAGEYIDQVLNKTWHTTTNPFTNRWYIYYNYWEEPPAMLEHLEALASISTDGTVQIDGRCASVLKLVYKEVFPNKLVEDQNANRSL